MFFQLEFFTRFKVAHPRCKIGLRAFENLKPYYVRRLTERNTCACKYHAEMVELRLGFNNMRTACRGVHRIGCICFCDVCHGSKHTIDIRDENSTCHASLTQFSGLTDLWYSVLCPAEDDGWHKPSCLTSKCNECGLDQLLTCPLEEDKSNALTMQWKCYEKVVHGKTRQGKDRMVLRLQYKTTTARMFLDYLRPKFRAFIVHNYIAKWQEEQYKISLDTFPPDSILSAVDFAENYSFGEFTEIQEQHWMSFQITILVHICYRWNPAFLANPHSGEQKLITEYHFYISDTNDHDTLFVQHCFDLHWEQLTSRGFTPNEHLVWSDGCAAQFKSRRTWYHVARYE